MGCISCARVCCRCRRQCVQQGMLSQATVGLLAPLGALGVGIHNFELLPAQKTARRMAVHRMGCQQLASDAASGSGRWLLAKQTVPVELVGCVAQHAAAQVVQGTQVGLAAGAGRCALVRHACRLPLVSCCVFSSSQATWLNNLRAPGSCAEFMCTD